MKQVFSRLACMIILSLWIVQPVSVYAQETPVAVGGIHILKTDVTGTPLEGAQFQICRELQHTELSDSSIQKKLVNFDGHKKIMAIESFWTDREMTGHMTDVAATDKLGKTAVYGLHYGTYYLVEEKAPEGFNRITEPIRFTVHKYSHLTESDHVCDDQGVLIDNTVHIINVRYSLPNTGQMGLFQLAAGGVGVIFSSAALILLNKNRWR